jgi:hypothetical protein
VAVFNEQMDTHQLFEGLRAQMLLLGLVIGLDVTAKVFEDDGPLGTQAPVDQRLKLFDTV